MTKPSFQTRLSFLVAALLSCVSVLAPNSWGGGNPKLTSEIPLERPFVPPVTSASGEVIVRRSDSSQEFLVKVFGIPPGTPVGGLAVFISDGTSGSNSFHFVNVMDSLSGGSSSNSTGSSSGTSSNGTVSGSWILDLVGKKTAPAQLGVTDVIDLSNRVVKILDTGSALYLETVIPPLVAKPSQLNYLRHIKFQRPDPAPSPKATGSVELKYTGKTGATIISVRIQNLFAGNSYCYQYMAFTNGIQNGVGTCGSLATLSSNGKLTSLTDTGAGDTLGTTALDNLQVGLPDLEGFFIVISDEFGVVHLVAPIPIAPSP